MNIESLIKELCKTSAQHGNNVPTNVDHIETKVSDDGADVSLVLHAKDTTHNPGPTTHNVCSNCKSMLFESDIDPVLLSVKCKKCGCVMNKNSLITLTLPSHYWERYRGDPKKWYAWETRKDNK